MSHSRPKQYRKEKKTLDLQDRETPFLPGRTKKYKAGGRLPCQVLLNQGKQRMTQTINEITGRRVSSLSEIKSTIQPTINESKNWQESFFPVSNQSANSKEYTKRPDTQIQTKKITGR